MLSVVLVHFQFILNFERSKHIKYWALSHNIKGYPTIDDFKKIINEIDNKRKLKNCKKAI